MTPSRASSRILVLAAAATVVAAHAGTVALTLRNRSRRTGGTLELTERELSLPPLLGDSTALFLRARWDVPSRDPDDDRAPAWLTAAKLVELGFDCRKPAGDPAARRHYSGVPPRPVYVVLELEGDAWKDSPNRKESSTRLFAVDAGLDPARLRETYRDPARYAVAKALVRLSLADRSRKDGSPLPEPRLRGWIEMLLPDEIFVPRPYCGLLQGLRGKEEEGPDGPGREPRFAVKVSWGVDHEPWVEGVRLLTPGSATPPAGPR